MSAHLSALKEKHEQIEKSIHNEEKRPSGDVLLIEKLKKRKLQLKEEIAKIEKDKS